MLVILLVFTLISTLRSVPLSSSLDDSNGLPALGLRDASSHFGERAISDIILSCFATIFACTWSAVHPNIPATTDCGWTRFKRQLVMMTCALLAPEALTAWALRQRLVARKIAKYYNKNSWVVEDNGTEMPKSHFILNTIDAIFHDSPLPPKLKAGQMPQWTIAHGFFVQMGGFLLSEGGRPIRTLSVTPLERRFKDPDRFKEAEIKWNVVNGIIDPPSTTEEDIQDRSKGDAFSKTLIILQTTWFIVQCIARWSNRLPVTELEVVTMGFAMLNGITYGLWWHKPQNIGRPVFLEIKRKPQEISNNSRKNPSVAEISNPRPTSEPEDSKMPPPGSSGLSGLSGTVQTPNKEEPASISAKPAPTKQSSLRQILRKDIKEHASSKPWKLLHLIPFHLVQGLPRLLGSLAEHRQWVNLNHGDSNLRVPMFYSEYAEDSQVYMLTMLIGVLFGLLHLITGWLLHFASVQEMWLWRVSAIVITVLPAIIGLRQCSIDCHWHNARDYTRYCYKIFEASLVGVLPLYIISRIILLTLALTSLRALPPAALQTVDWTTFIPHI